MNELDLILAWLTSAVGVADCGICNLINNSFDNVLNLVVGTAGTAGAVAGTVVGGATSAVNRIGDAARDAGDAFNLNYDRASGGTGSTPAPSGTVVAGPPEIQGPSAPRHPFGRELPPQPPGAIPHGTLQYFGVGGPAGPQVGSQQ